MVSPVQGIEQNYLFGALTGSRKVGGNISVNPQAHINTAPAVAFRSNDTGEIRSDYGQGGAYAGAYHGLTNDPNQTVGKVFDTNRLYGIYGF